MSPNDRPRTAEGTLEERLRAAGNALREASAAQVDAATGLREIVHGARAVPDDQALPLADQPLDLAAAEAPPPAPPTRLLRASQRLALVVNLLLVVALGFALVRVTGDRRQPVATAPVVTATTTVPRATALSKPPVPASTVKGRVPEECLDAAELADEVIARLNRNQRDSRLALALRDYSVASQACRRAAR
jgi:hypothetical protein